MTEKKVDLSWKERAAREKVQAAAPPSPVTHAAAPSGDFFREVYEALANTKVGLAGKPGLPEEGVCVFPLQAPDGREFQVTIERVA